MAKRHHLRHPTTHATLPPALVARSAPDANPWSNDYNPIAHARLTRTRAEVQREYLAAREQVAALTGQDSGSTYLARVAARQSAVRATLEARALRKGQSQS